MEAIMRIVGKKVMIMFIFSILSTSLYGQYCDSITPSFTVDLSSSPNQTWTSPSVARDGNCCGTSTPDKCLEFIITLAPDAIAVNFQITGGAVPPGALFYQIDCGPITPVGSPICLNGAGPHHLTFCKPGNNSNEFSITSYSDPIIGPDISLCQDESGLIFADYYNEASMTWTSVSPGVNGAYNSLLDCTAGCDTTNVTASGILPPFVDYLVCGMDIAGCYTDPICDTIRVNFHPQIVPEIIDLQHAWCNGDQNGDAEISILGGTAPLNLEWNTVPTQTGNILADVGAGTYTCTISDANGCSETIDVTITEPVSLQIGLGSVPPSCFGSSDGAISSAVIGGTPPYSYLWSNGATSSNIYGLTAGNYSVTVTDSNGCEITAATNLVDPLPLNGTITAPQVSCTGAPVILSVNVNGGSGNLGYMWTPTASNNDTVSVAPLNDTSYSCEITDANGCSLTLNTSISVITMDPGFLNAMMSNNTACEGDSVALTAQWTGSDPVTLSWQHCPACPTDQAIYEYPTSNSVYTLIATDACGNSVSDSVMITLNPLPIIMIATDDNTLCPGESVILSNNGSNGPGYTYSWDFGDGNTSASSNPSYTYDDEGVYMVSLTLTDPNGCTNVVNNGAFVTVHPQAVAIFSSDASSMTTLDPSFEFTNFSYNSSVYSWNFGDGNTSNSVHASHSYDEAGFYTVSLYANNVFGCPDSTFITIEVKPDWEIFVPNTFTPDGDQYNSSFFAKGYGISDKDYTFQIFNRWGDLIFESRDMEIGWDGTEKRGLTAAQDGTYTWVVYFRDLTEKRHRREGHVNLLK